MKVYYVEFNDDWEIKEIELENLKYKTFHKYNNELNRVSIGKYIDGRFYSQSTRYDMWFLTLSQAIDWINKESNIFYTLQDILEILNNDNGEEILKCLMED